jgi:hypothetical protein
VMHRVELVAVVVYKNENEHGSARQKGQTTYAAEMSKC